MNQLNIPNHNYYGDVTRWFVGTVAEAGTDPKNLNRVKVRIDGVHGPNIDITDLPYAQCVLPTTGGGVSGLGENPRLEAGARVIGLFVDGAASQSPVVMGFMPQFARPNGTQLNNAPPVKQPVMTTTEAGREGGAYSSHFNPRLTPGNYTNPHIAYAFFSQQPGLLNAGKYTPHRIAGMIGNFMIEGRKLGPPLEENGVRPDGTFKRFYIEMDPTTTGIEDKDGSVDKKSGFIQGSYIAFGIAQWGKSRGEDLKRYADDLGEDVNSLITQLRFVDHELHANENLRGEFFQTDDTLEATMEFMRSYERPALQRPLVKSPHHNDGKFGRVPNHWDIRAKEEERIKEARAAYILFSQHYPES